MRFDQYTVALLLLRTDAPSLSQAEEDALQDAHMAHLSDLHAGGDLLIAGPVLGDDDRELRGFAVYACDRERAVQLANDDPAVRAGRYRHELHSWIVPGGIMSFTRAHLPASMAEARG